MRETPKQQRTVSVGAVWRRRFVVFLALAFLLSGVLHAGQHYEGAGGIAVAQTVSNGTDEAPDGPAKAAGSVAHCLGCAAAIQVADFPPPKPELVARAAPLPPDDALTLCQRHHDTPPPRA